ncbi:general substrate transporter [Lipomyces japonicus]|uniref:general substrate transporter n=1 Tax=Lipomyces japonicus TaxID=56871 RepID=UPI0034CFBF7D
MVLLSVQSKEQVEDLEHQLKASEYGIDNVEGSYGVTEAKRASDQEHAMPFLQAIKTYRKAAMWSMIVSTCIIMEGYDIVLVGSLYAQPAFQEKYGEYFPGIGYQIPARWQIAIGNGTQAGAIIGAFANGWLTDRFGYRKLLLACMALTAAFIFVPFFAPNIQVMLVGQVLCGLPWGVFATMAPAYAAEVCPLALRGYFTIYVDMCWAIGQLIAAGVLQGTSNVTTKWAYKIPFAVQWIWPVLLIGCFWFAPESPWWLVRKGKLETAEKTIERLKEKNSTTSSKETVAWMLHTQAIEAEIQSGVTYLDCFKGVDRRRTEVVMMTYASQNLCGLAIGGSPTYFFTQAGIAASNAFKFTVGILSLGVVCIAFSWYLITRIGRRTLYVYGLAVLASLLFLIGFLAIPPTASRFAFAQAGIVFAWAIVFYMTLGPVCFAIISETSSMRLRAKSVSLARNSYYMVGIVINVLNPYMVNSSAWDWRGKTAFFYAGTCTACFVWAFFRLPETKDRTYEELDVLFANKIPATKFDKYDVDVYAVDNNVLKKREKAK